ncbi:general stress protein [Lysinibacillus odysseyi]|uniref:General stress protein 17M-like domain-containing protein n=1 Tax=Lysinibacillus odysseyi 34hs-1 = NBRC 100172 TaxID=1220589 RepID=A0A0A3JGJ7_9BACI|nr:general stress protein [Lysinibacillus odysseyi]KGR86152.1 hypothetical protein CD32_07080 [Lysinibacillus odysseyi 34hs-1 = NBRC 100172]
MDKNYRIEVANGHEDFFYKLETLKAEGFSERDIHIFSKDVSTFENLKADSDIHTHEAGNWIDKFKSFFTGEDAVTETLRQIDLTEEEISYLSHELSQGASIIYARKDTSEHLAPLDTIVGQQSEYELKQQADQEARNHLDDIDVMRRRM